MALLHYAYVLLCHFIKGIHLCNHHLIQETELRKKGNRAIPSPLRPHSWYPIIVTLFLQSSLCQQSLICPPSWYFCYFKNFFKKMLCKQSCVITYTYRESYVCHFWIGCFYSTWCSWDSFFKIFIFDYWFTVLIWFIILLIIGVHMSPPSHLPPIPTPLGYYRAWVALSHTANSCWLPIYIC